MFIQFVFAFINSSFAPRVSMQWRVMWWSIFYPPSSTSCSASWPKPHMRTWLSTWLGEPNTHTQTHTLQQMGVKYLVCSSKKFWVTFEQNSSAENYNNSTFMCFSFQSTFPFFSLIACIFFFLIRHSPLAHSLHVCVLCLGRGCDWSLKLCRKCVNEVSVPQNKCNSYLRGLSSCFLVLLYFYITLCVSPQGDGSCCSTVPWRRAWTLLEILCEGAVVSQYV